MYRSGMTKVFPNLRASSEFLLESLSGLYPSHSILFAFHLLFGKCQSSLTFARIDSQAIFWATVLCHDMSFGNQALLSKNWTLSFGYPSLGQKLNLSKMAKEYLFYPTGISNCYLNVCVLRTWAVPQSILDHQGLAPYLTVLDIYCWIDMTVAFYSQFQHAPPPILIFVSE